MLFFGVPENATDAFGNLVKLALEESNGCESKLMKTLRRDVLWLQDTNSKYTNIHTSSRVQFTLPARRRYR